jgi:hypothetical protein
VPVSSSIISEMGEPLLVTRRDGSTMRYTLEDEQSDGSILLKPDTSADAIMERADATSLSIEDLEQLAGQPIPRDDKL